MYKRQESHLQFFGRGDLGTDHQDEDETSKEPSKVWACDVADSDHEYLLLRIAPALHLRAALCQIEAVIGEQKVDSSRINFIIFVLAPAQD